MSTPREPEPAMLFLSILAARWEAFWPGLKTDLAERFGPVEYEAGPLPFVHTSYYDAELGTPVTRHALCFSRLAGQDILPEIKLRTNALEQERRRPDGGRIFNLDPGLLTLDRLVLATGKNYSHRVYLGQGIFADLTLLYREGHWQPLPWTYPDYAENALRAHLDEMRRRCKLALAAWRRTVAGARPQPEEPAPC